MAKSNYLSESELLEKFRIALTNAESQPDIASALEEIGYDTAEIAKGKALWDEAEKVFEFNKKEDAETSLAYSEFKKKRDELNHFYKLHRKKAKVVFRNEPELLKQLKLDKALPASYIKWLGAVKDFYSAASAHENIKTKLQRLKVTPDELSKGSEMIASLESARAEYKREVGESQDATKQKDAALSKLEDFMSEFYAIAAIALEDRPQLLESLSKQVLS
jgi:hypothetical protein